MTLGPDRNAARLKLPSKFTDMSPSDMEHSGGTDQETLCWISIGAGIAVATMGIVATSCGISRFCKAASLKKIGSIQNGIHDVDRQMLIKVITSRGKKCIAGGIVGILLGAGGIVGGCFLNDSSD